MTQEKATARPCSHNHATNYNGEIKAAYDNGQMLCWDCDQMFTPEPLPQSYASLVNERDALLSEVAQLRNWKESAMHLLGGYDAVAETFGSALGSSKVKNLERGVAQLREALESIKQCQNEVKCRRCLIIADKALGKER